LNQSAYTPGPWTADAGDYPVIVNAKAGNQIICIIEDPDIRTAATAHTQRENDANARLIAAAPDLLEALRHALDWNADDIRTIEDITPSLEMLKNRRKVLRDAIAKATKGGGAA
jgi:hypothetical protein